MLLLPLVMALVVDRGVARKVLVVPAGVEGVVLVGSRRRRAVGEDGGGIFVGACGV